MPKPKVNELRYDFSGGLNTAVAPDRLERNELVTATNVRLTGTTGALTKRGGTRRYGQAACGTTGITGVVQWDAPSGKEVVAVSNEYDRIYTVSAITGTPTAHTPAVLSGSAAKLYPMRAATSGAPLVLYIGDGQATIKWDGTTATQIDGTSDVPAADLLIPYHTRMFYRDPNYEKHAFWSQVGNAEYCTAGGQADGGSALVDVLSGESITNYEVVGSSLLIFTEDCVMRFTGYSNTDIRIDQDTEGVSAEVGCVGPHAATRVENVVFFLSDRGPYIATEAGVQFIGQKVRPDFDALDRANLANAVVAYHRGKREVWYAVSGASDSDLNKTVYVYSLELNSWAGPWTYSFGIQCMTRFEDPTTGAESLIAGCSDGWLRLMDIGYKDDTLYDASGGSAVTMTAEPAPAFTQAGPGTTKIIERCYTQASITSAQVLTLKLAGDAGSLTSYTITGVGSNYQSYKNDTNIKGKRVRVQYVDATSTAAPAIVAGYILHGADLLRDD